MRTKSPEHFVERGKPNSKVFQIHRIPAVPIEIGTTEMSAEEIIACQVLLSEEI